MFPALKTPLERLQEYKQQGGSQGQALSFIMGQYPQLSAMDAAAVVAEVFPAIGPQPPAPTSFTLPNIADLVAAMGQQTKDVIQNTALYPSFSEQSFKQTFSEEPLWRMGSPIQVWWVPGWDAAKPFTYNTFDIQTGEQRSITIPGNEAALPNIPPSALLETHLLDAVPTNPVPHRLPLTNEGVFEVGPTFFQVERTDIPGGLHFINPVAAPVAPPVASGNGPFTETDRQALNDVVTNTNNILQALRKVNIVP